MNITASDGITVTVTPENTLPDDYGTPVVCSLSTDGKTTVLDSKRDGNKVIFTTNHNNYYVIAAKAGGSPQTGDNSNMILWIALLFVSGGALVTLGIEKKRRIANSK